MTMKTSLYTALAFAAAILLPPRVAGAANNNTVTFTVTDSAKAPLAGALITVDSAKTATTGADGSATIDLAQGGDAHEFTVVRDGCFNVLSKLPAGKTQAAVALRKYAPWDDFIINNFDSNDPAKNRVKYFPAKPAVRRTAPGWFLNCLGEHEGTTLTYGSDNSASFTKGNCLTCDFEGATIRVFTLRTRNSGMAKITVDGKFPQTVDLSSRKDSKTSDYEVAYEKYDLPQGKHTVKLEVLGEKGSKSSGGAKTDKSGAGAKKAKSAKAAKGASANNNNDANANANDDDDDNDDNGGNDNDDSNNGNAGSSIYAKVYFDFLDTSDYPVFPRFGIGAAVGVVSNTAKEVAFALSMKTAGPGGFKSVEETGFVVVDAALKRAPTVNDMRIKAPLDAGHNFRAAAPASNFKQRVKYVAMPYAVVGGNVYYGNEPVFFTPAPEIALKRTVLGIQAGHGPLSTRTIALAGNGGYSDLKWKVQSQRKYDGAPATGIVSCSFKDGAAAAKDAPVKITGLAEGEAVIRCYSAGNPDKYEDCLVTVARPNRNAKIAQRPLMGWSTWSAYGRSITRELMKEIADGMLKPLPAAGGKSLKELGYDFLLVDGGWRVNWLAPDGRIVPNSRMGGVDGMKALSKYLHDNGMKMGLHMCPGWGDCAGQPMGADGFEKIHLAEYADWMIDNLFVDSCFTEKGRRKDPDEEYMQTLYSKFKYYSDNCGRDIILKATGGFTKKTWGTQLVNYFRVGGDIAQYINTSSEGGGRWVNPTDGPSPKNSAAFVEAKNVANNWKHIGQDTGLWGDPDQMVFGDPGLNMIEQQSMFNMWSITGSPLVLGGTMSDLTDEKKGIVQIITNTEVIAVDQDQLGRIGHVLKSYTNNPAYGAKHPDISSVNSRPEVNLTVYGRPLFDGSWALVIMNNTKQAQTITVKFADLDYDGFAGGKTKLTKGVYYLRNLNTREDMGKFEDQFTYKNLPVHGSVMIKVTPEKYHQDCDCH